MNVAFLRSNPVNPDPRIEKEVKSLVAHGYDVKIVCWDRTGSLAKEDSLLANNVNVPIFRGGSSASFGGGTKNLFKLLKFQAFLLKWLLLNKSKYNIIHAADFDTVLPALFMKLIFRKRIVYDIFDFYIDAFTVPQKLKGIIKKLDFFAIKVADGVIITNETRFEQIEGSNPKKIVVLHNSPSLHSLNQMLPLEAGESNNYSLTFAYVGILQDARLLEELLELFAKRKDWLLKIAGFGKHEETIKLYAEKNANIVFYGSVPYAMGLKISASSDILFATYDPNIPNHKYSSPNKLYEAMLLSKPIIVCKGTGIDTIVDEHQIGISINYDVSDFERHVDIMLNDAVSRDAMGTRAHKIFMEHYSWEIMEGRLLEMYRSI